MFTQTTMPGQLTPPETIRTRQDVGFYTICSYSGRVATQLVSRRVGWR
ncbi:hypothetical protein BTZ20_5594 [Rhodococcus sp. MTM3W5.2]|nr:hypothetical protein BTZ20_5594 [Rhodococcus sp. MTM3W5.2]